MDGEERRLLAAEKKQLARADIMRRVGLANATFLLECTDPELVALVEKEMPQLDRGLLPQMSREQMVSLLLND